MTTRYTVNDVRAIFETFCELARSVGFDTEGWELEIGNSSYHRQFRHVQCGKSSGPSSTEFRPELGANTREAWTALSNRIDALRAFRDLRGDTERTNAGVELPPMKPAELSKRGPRFSIDDYGRGPAVGN